MAHAAEAVVADELVVVVADAVVAVGFVADAGAVLAVLRRLEEAVGWARVGWR